MVEFQISNLAVASSSLARRSWEEMMHPEKRLAKVRTAALAYRDALQSETRIARELATKLQKEGGDPDATAYRAAAIAYNQAMTHFAVVFDALEEH